MKILQIKITIRGTNYITANANRLLKVSPKRTNDETKIFPITKQNQ